MWTRKDIVRTMDRILVCCFWVYLPFERVPFTEVTKGAARDSVACPEICASFHQRCIDDYEC